jgi:hypothetical protein
MDDFILVKAALDKYDYAQLRDLELETHVPAGTMAKIKGGQTANPRYRTVKLLANYFRAKAAQAEAVN